MLTANTELTDCHDCRGAVAFGAASCPHCGSREPGGPYVLSPRERRQYRIEERNDRNLVMVSLCCAIAGGVYGALTASSVLGAVVSGLGYGCLGALVGVPAAFVINVTRHLGR